METFIIAIENEKGGSGKTNTAIGLACGLKAAGYDVVVIDNDPQGGSMRWKRNSSSDNFPPVVLLGKNLEKTDTELYKASFLIIDGEPGIEANEQLKKLVRFMRRLSDDTSLPSSVRREINQGLREIIGSSLEITVSTVSAIKLSDLVIVPMKGSDQDVEPSMNLIDNLLKPRFEATGKPIYKALINEVPYSGNTINDGKSLQAQLRLQLTVKNIPVFNTTIHTRQQYREANTYGHTVFDEKASYEKCRVEMENLTMEVLETLGVKLNG
ncbi:MAG: AAA family ATPase [Pseudomonadales bacterium]|nr:AAA family ATPase [Pseudomonadales bacterium]